jgi:hypothetical protein
MSSMGGRSSTVQWRYMFDVSASVVRQWVGESPKGKRMDIHYPSGRVSTHEGRYLRDWWGRLNEDMRKKVIDVLEKCGLESSQEKIWESIGKFRDVAHVARGGERESAFRDQCLDELRDGKVTPLQWFGFEGKVIAGSNWVTVRPDLVAEFSGRMTLQSNDEDQALIDAIFTGVTDLGRGEPDAKIFGKENFANLRAAAAKGWEGERAAWPTILIPVTFDVGGAAQKWAPKRYIRRAQGYWKYQRLTQGQFIAIGTIGIGSALEDTQETQATLEVYEVRAGGPAGAEPRAFADEGTRQ